MAGLDPAIHAFEFPKRRKKDVDARHKAGHDGTCEAESLSARR